MTIAVQPAAAQQDLPVTRMAFTSVTVADMNRADALIALNMLAQTFIKNRSIGTRIVADLCDQEALPAAIQSRKIDIAILRTDEFIPLQKAGLVEPMAVAFQHGSPAEEFILLVNGTQGIKDIRGLQARSLMVMWGRRTGLSRMWLDVLLHDAGLPTAEIFFSEVRESPKLSAVVLPVFFRQKDACVVTYAGFETMVRLNPQLGRQLSILSRSAPILPSLMCFRRGFDPKLRERLLAAVEDLHSDPAGSQALTMFGMEKLERCTPDHLKSALALVDQYQRFKSSPLRQSGRVDSGAQGNAIAH
jgi:ABC-type phosphate/phosphonate transport system substrate-binding protein